MAVYHVDSVKEYESLKELKDQVILVDFTAKWCRPCQGIAPLLDKLAEENPKVVIISVDIDKLGDDLDDAGDVKGVPTFKYFINGELLSRFSGANITKVKSVLKEMLEKC